MGSLVILMLLSGPSKLGSGDIALPRASYKGAVSVEEVLKARRTHRAFSAKPLSLQQFAQLLWAAYGRTAENEEYTPKTAPSAGALYPLDVYAAVGAKSVEGVSAGVYAYRPRTHRVARQKAGDLRASLARASHDQRWMAEAPLLLIVTGESARSEVKYGRRGKRYTDIEAGHVGQNVFLQAEALGLKAGIVGAFEDTRVNELLGIPPRHQPLLILPVGYARGRK